MIPRRLKSVPKFASQDSFLLRTSLPDILLVMLVKHTHAVLKLLLENRRKRAE